MIHFQKSDDTFLCVFKQISSMDLNRFWAEASNSEPGRLGTQTASSPQVRSLRAPGWQVRDAEPMGHTEPLLCARLQAAASKIQDTLRNADPAFLSQKTLPFDKNQCAKHLLNAARYDLLSSVMK